MNAKKVSFASKAELLKRRTKSTCTPPPPSGILKKPRRASEAPTAFGPNKENELPAAELPAAESPVKVIVAPRKMRSLSDAEVSEIFGDDTSLCKHRKSEVEKLIDDQRSLNLVLGPGEKRTRRKPKAFGEQENTEEKSARTPRKKAEKAQKPPQRPRARTDFRAESIAAPKKRRGRPTKSQKQTKVPVEENVRTPIPEPHQQPIIERPLATNHNLPVIDPPAPAKSLAESIQFARFPDDVKHFSINDKISYCRLTANVGMIQMSGEKNHFHFKHFLFQFAFL